MGMSGFEVRTIPDRHMNLQKILTICCEEFDVPIDMVVKKNRKRELVSARYAYATIARSILHRHSLRQIGELVSLDHSAVLYAIKTSKTLLEVRDLYYTPRFNNILHRLGVVAEMTFK